MNTTRDFENDPFLNPAVIAAVSRDDIFVLSQGNPGAITAMLEMIAEYSKIDPQAAMGGFHVTMFLKDNNFRGTQIWNLWKNVCLCKPVNFVAVMRGHQMGFIECKIIERLAQGDTHALDFDLLIKQIKNQLPLFNHQEK